MRVYADTSFLVRLLAQEAGTNAAINLYRGLKRPPLYYLPIHALEVENAIRERAFHERQFFPRAEKGAISRNREKSLGILKKFIARRAFVEVSADFEPGILLARKLSEKRTERLGCRGFDLLHVALAIQLKCELFITADHTQGDFAKIEGLKVVVSVD